MLTTIQEHYQILLHILDLLADLINWHVLYLQCDINENENLRIAVANKWESSLEIFTTKGPEELLEREL